MRERRIEKTVADEFVHEQWKPIAIAAWRNYLRMGRGALLCNWTWIERWAAGQPFGFYPPYMTKAEIPEVQTLIDSYDPETAIVMVFTTDDAATGKDTAAPQEVTATGTGRVRAMTAGSEVAAWIFTHAPAPPDSHHAASH